MASNDFLGFLNHIMVPRTTELNFIIFQRGIKHYERMRFVGVIVKKLKNGQI